MKFIAVIALTIVVLIPSSMARFKNPICSLPPFKNGHGDVMCLAHFPSWSYSSISNECAFFIYGGCGGNENRFGSKEQCEQVCKL